MRKLTVLVCFFFIIAFVKAEIITYSVPKELYYARHNDDFTVKVRQQGEKDWIDLFEYKVKVDMDTNSDASMVTFDFSGTVEVLVQQNNGMLQSAVVRPLSKGIVPVITGNALIFTLDRPEDLSIECNGDRLHNLHLFTNMLETARPSKDDPNVMYFAAGFHEPENNETKSFHIPSNTTVYLEGGAVLKGRIRCDSVEHVKITGRGMLLEPEQGIVINYSKHIEIDNLIALNPRYYTVSGGQSQHITIRNLRSFSYQGWSDGIDLMSCSDVLIDRVFMRNSDDCIALYAHRWEFYGDTRNITVQHSTLWADVAHPINIGTHGNTEYGEGEVFDNIHFNNIDILEHDEDDRDYQGCMAINVGDHNLAQNITFENIRVENIQEGQLFHLRVMYNSKYNTGPGRGIRDITFRNIYYDGKYENPSLIEGYDNQRTIDGITFENIVINGKKVFKIGDLNINKGNFVRNLKMK